MALVVTAVIMGIVNSPFPLKCRASERSGKRREKSNITGSENH